MCIICFHNTSLETYRAVLWYAHVLCEKLLKQAIQKQWFVAVRANLPETGRLIGSTQLITVFTKARYRFLFRVRWVPSIVPILILSSHVLKGFPSGVCAGAPKTDAERFRETFSSDCKSTMALEPSRPSRAPSPSRGPQMSWSKATDNRHISDCGCGQSFKYTHCNRAKYDKSTKFEVLLAAAKIQTEKDKWKPWNSGNPFRLTLE